MKKRAPKKNFAPQLLYGDLQYACIHGGRKYKSKSTAARPQQHTFQLECPFQLQISSSEDGTKLMVTEMNEQHNHEMSETALKMRCNEKILQRHLQQETGKVVLLKDLTTSVGHFEMLPVLRS